MQLDRQRKLRPRVLHEVKFGLLQPRNDQFQGGERHGYKEAGDGLDLEDLLQCPTGFHPTPDDVRFLHLSEDHS